MAKATYDDLIFQLGDLARDRLADRPNCPASMEQVFQAEETVTALREELATLEHQMNEEDVAYQEFLAAQQDEQAELKPLVLRWKRAVDGVEVKVKDLRKKLNSRRAERRYADAGLKKEDLKHKDMELSGAPESKIEVSRQNLKKLRLTNMRRARDIEEMEREFDTILTPTPGQPGEQGILAHKRILEMEDQAIARKEEFAQLMADYEQAIADKDSETQEAEQALEEALFALGEEVYSLRVSDPSLAPLYPQLDKAS